MQTITSDLSTRGRQGPEGRRRARALAFATALSLGAVTSLAAAATAAGPPVGPLGQSEASQRDQVEQAAALAQAQPATALQRRAPSTPSTSPAGEAIEAIEAGMDQVVADGAIAVTVRVDTPDLAWADAAGDRRLDGPPATARGEFRVASNTKMMVAALVMQEVQAGTWTLDTPVADVIPGLFPDHPDVTIRHLLSHTSGAPTGTDLMLLSRISDPSSIAAQVEALGLDYTEQDYVDAVNAVPWEHEPGAGFTYSNAGYAALGMLLEEVTGREVGQLLKDRVFKPAGMRHTSYPDEPGMAGHALQEAFWDGEQWWSLNGFDPDVFSHAGAAVSTTADLNAFTEALIGGELFDPALLPQMLGGSPLPTGYGLGIYAVPDPCVQPGEPQALLWGHDGMSFGTASIALTSADGTRQLSLAVTGRNLSADPDALFNLEDVLVPALLATC